MLPLHHHDPHDELIKLHICDEQVLTWGFVFETMKEYILLIPFYSHYGLHEVRSVDNKVSF